LENNLLYERHGCSSSISASTAKGASQIALLLTSFSLLSLAGLFQYHFNTGLNKQIQVDWSSISWVRDVQFNLENTQETAMDSAPIVAPQKVQKQFFRQVRAKRVKRFAKPPVLGKKIARVDQVSLTQAQSVTVHQVDAQEQRKLAEMHHDLIAKFLIAFNATTGQPQDIVAKTPLTPATVSKPRSTLVVRKSLAKAHLSKHKIKKQIDRKIAAFSKPVYDIPRTDVVEAARVSTEWNEIRTSAFEEVLQQASISHPQVFSELSWDENHKQVSQVLIQSISKNLVRLGAKPMSDSSNSFVAEGRRGDEVVSTQAQRSQDMSKDMSKDTMNTQISSDISKAGLSLTPVVVDVRTAEPSHQLASLSAPVSVSAPAVTTQSPDVSGVTTQQSEVNTRDDSAEDQVRASVPPFIEAFDSADSMIMGVTTRMISADQINGTMLRGWQVAREDLDHWPTVAWLDPANLGPQSVPLIKSSTLQFLNAWYGVSPQAAHAGIIFGKIARGWEVEFAGTADKPVYLDTNRQLVSEGSANEFSEERYFIITNAAPGAQSIKLVSHWGEGKGAIAVPVLEGTSSYLDLTQIAKRNLIGKVIDETTTFHENVSEDPYKNHLYTIQVMDQSTASTVTNQGGQFQIQDVITASNYPFYVKTFSASGKPHQYRVLPSDMLNVPLYRISQQRIDSWLSQVDESPEDSDLIAVAVPQLIDPQSERSLIPALIHQISPETRIKLNSFTVAPYYQDPSPWDAVQKDNALMGNKDRFFGIRIPKGLVTAQVSNKDDDVIWSDLVMNKDERAMSGIGVVHIVAPH
jgi:hypothetical protein